MKKPYWPVAFAVLAIVVAVITATASASSSRTVSPVRALTGATGHWCEAQPRKAAANKVPVWIYMEIKDHHGNVVSGVGLALLPYRGMRFLGNHGGVFSGCYAVQLFPKGHVPTRYCIALHLGIQAPGGNCKPVTTSPTGQRMIVYSLTTP